MHISFASSPDSGEGALAFDRIFADQIATSHRASMAAMAAVADWAEALQFRTDLSSAAIDNRVRWIDRVGRVSARLMACVQRSIVMLDHVQRTHQAERQSAPHLSRRPQPDVAPLRRYGQESADLPHAKRAAGADRDAAAGPANGSGRTAVDDDSRESSIAPHAKREMPVRPLATAMPALIPDPPIAPHAKRAEQPSLSIADPGQRCADRFLEMWNAALGSPSTVDATREPEPRDSTNYVISHTESPIAPHAKRDATIEDQAGAPSEPPAETTSDPQSSQLPAPLPPDAPFVVISVGPPDDCVPPPAAHPPHHSPPQDHQRGRRRGRRR